MFEAALKIEAELQLKWDATVSTGQRPKKWVIFRDTNIWQWNIFDLVLNLFIFAH